MIIRILLALVLGAIAYFVAHLFLNQTLSSLIGVLVGLAYFFGDNTRSRL